MTLETSRLILRPFRNEDIDLLAELMANPDFMRFSLGVFSREQTASFLEKLIDWDRRSLPSQFAVIHRDDHRLIGYSGFFHQQVDGTSEIEIGYRLHPEYWNNVPSRRVAEKNGMKLEKQTVFRGFPTLVFAINRKQGAGACREVN